MRPLELPDFETQARRLRYQALGAACRAENITNLLLAHHADDQAETVLMRLSSGHKSIGLRGMHSSSDIPECWGVYGVHRSGKHEAALGSHDRLLSETENVLRLDSLGQRDLTLLSYSGLFEQGGVQILRPLLKFRKQDLIDTCQAHGVEWSEDATNRDTWRTTRNATRSLLSNFRLPMALETPSLVQLSSHMKGREARHNKCVSRLNELCEMLLFDLRCGSLVVRLPKLPSTEAITVDAAQSSLSLSRSLTASILVRRLVNLVTPQEDVPLHSLKRAVTAIFPSLAHLKGATVEEQVGPSVFTTAGILFERIHSPISNIDIKSDSNVNLGRDLGIEDLDTNFIWSLTRQPFAKVSAHVEFGGLKDAPITILIDGAPSGRNNASESSLWSSWQLWDGRYWIRIKNLTAQPLRVRPFCESDLRAIRKSAPKSTRKPLEEILASAAPNKVRWTLPVIAHAVGEDGKLGKVLALPTLGKTGMIDVKDEKGQRKVEWEVRYKKVNLGRRHDGTRRGADIITSWEDS